MSTLTWILGKQLEREINNNGVPISLEKKKKPLYIAVEKK